MASLHRRHFLQRAGAAAAAAAWLGPPTGLRAEERPRTGPNATLAVAVLGIRSRGQQHAQAFANLPGCRVTHLCDCDRALAPPLADKIAELQGSAPTVVDDLRRVFDDPAVDVVSIALPNHWHALAAIWAMQAGKDVYLEKPVSHNLSEGRRLVQVASKYQRICQAGTQYRSSGAHQAAADYLAAGKLGKIHSAHCYTYRIRRPIGAAGVYTPPETLDYELWAGPAPKQVPVTRSHFHQDWHWFWDYGNGELGNNSVHRVDAARLMLGNPGLGQRVLSYGARHFHDAGQTPNTQVTLHDLGGLTLVQEVRNLPTLDVENDGNIVITGSEGQLVSTLSEVTLFDPKGKPRGKLTAPNENHFENFLAAVRSRQPDDLRADITEGHLSTAMIHTANISQRLGREASVAEIVTELEKLSDEGRAVETFAAIRRHLSDNGLRLDREPLVLGSWLTLDAERERFVDNEAANALLTREYREPFVVPEEDKI